MQKKATQRDVARRAGVSQATVSLVLAGSAGPAIRPLTSARVLEVARDLGYAPNRSAQALRTKRTRTIAVAVPDISNPFFPSLLKGVQTVADRDKYDVLAVNTDGLAEHEQRFLRWSLEGRVDGVIGVFFTLRAEDFEPLIALGIGVVRIESARKLAGELPIDNIYVDNRAAAAAATRYLIDRGHRRIAMIAGPAGPQAERAAGYALALGERGLASDIVGGAEFSEEEGRRAAAILIARKAPPTAIFAANDIMAIGAMSALRENGLSVPSDVAVVGFDDIFVARLVTPALTTVSQFQQDIGVRAGETLLDRLRGAASARGTSREMPFRLIERDST
ncbi:MAG TPA: LacI family DNA-binding transcriptional regulator [Roseiarcus sp.]|nr:LacI family DNA-binding transcriptional regulator [Roseiarcus sp.]